MSSTWIDLLFLFCGIVFAVEISIRIFRGFKAAWFCHFIPWIRKTDLIKMYGPWAVVTGASSGIGLGFVNYLASQGFNIVLISRRQTVLDNIAIQIEDKYGVQTRVIACDLASRDSYKCIKDCISGLDIGILVNNAGMLANDKGRPIYFHETDAGQIYDIITVNCGAALVLTKDVAEHMMAKESGLVVNLSSVASYAPLPFMCQYSATKIFLDTMSKCLREELKVAGVTVKSVRPLLVKSNMTSCNSFAYGSILAQTPDDYMRHLAPTLTDNLSTSGYWLADLYMWPFRNFPDWYRTAISTTLLPYIMKCGHGVQINN